MHRTGIVLPGAPRRDWRLWHALRSVRLGPVATSRWTPYVCLGGMLAVLMWPAWTSTRFLVVGGDVVLIHYPWFVLWRDLLAAHQGPWWNPYTLGGLPAFATLQSGYGYPPHWLLSWLPALQAINWTVGLHVVLAGLGTAWCAGRMGASRAGQVLAGVAYALGSATSARMIAGHLSFLEANAWLPIATGCALRLRSGRDLAALAGSLAMLALAGQPELVIFATWWLPLWAIASATVAAHEAGRSAFWHIPRAVVYAVLGLAAGGALAAYQLWPTAALLGASNRAAGMSWDFRTGASLPPWHLLELLSPTVFGSSADTSYWAGAWFDWHERLLYVGIVPLLLVAWAPRGWRLACLGSAGVAVLLAFGSYTPWYAWTNVWPGYQTFRIPSKHLVLAALALALAAGLGLDQFRGKRALLSGVIAALGVPLIGVSSSLWLPWLVRLWPLSDTAQAPDGNTSAALPLTASAALLGAGLLALAPRVWRTCGLVVLAAAELTFALHAYRLVSADPSGLAGALQFVQDQGRVAVLGDPGGTLGNYGPLSGIEQPTGYTSLFSSGYAQLLVGTPDPGVVVTVSAADARVLRLLGYRALFDPETRTVSMLEPPPVEAWVARCARPGGAAEARADGFPLEECVTSRDGTSDEAPATPGRAQVRSWMGGQIDLQADGPGWLVTVVPWYPGWSAVSDGQSVPVSVLDGALVGVRLPAGSHAVRLQYLPAGLVSGAALSILTLALLALTWVWSDAQPAWLRRLGRAGRRAWRQ